MANGGARPGAGRKPGAATAMNEEARKRALEGGMSPLEYLLGVMRDTNQDAARRLDAAKAAAPYVHARLASAEIKADVSAKIDVGPSWLPPGRF
jgi:hypothetical protein